MTTKSSYPRQRVRGFTLVELTVALAAGLIVALAVVGLSKEATNTFHEEMRAATAQMSLRTAVDRLRGDLSRASFMSSPNIYGDPSLVSNFDPTTQVFGIRRLAGIRLFAGGSRLQANIGSGFPTPTMQGTDNGAFAYSNNNGLNPDAIDITGNLNSVDSYAVQSTGAATNCSGTRLLLSALNPSAYRLAATPGASGPADALRRAFVPVTGSNFIVRLQDAQGRVQYLESCGAGYVGTQPFVEVIGTPVQGTGTGNVGGEAGFYSGSTVNPVLTVRYKLAPTQAPYGDLNPTNDATKFDLYRVYIDSTGNEVGTPELVAEYAIDLKFSFTVDNTATTNPPPPTTTRTHATFPFADDTNNGAWGVSPTSVSAANPPASPQRIRSARFRLVTRTAVPDRSILIAPPTANPSTPTDYMYRYCTAAVTKASCKQLARIRTVITEVNLNNQAGALYP